MTEIEKLRLRIKSVHKNAVQFYMTVDEARTLLKEIDQACNIQPTKTIDTAIKISTNIKIIDGGEF